MLVLYERTNPVSQTPAPQTEHVNGPYIETLKAAYKLIPPLIKLNVYQVLCIVYALLQLQQSRMQKLNLRRLKRLEEILRAI